MAMMTYPYTSTSPRVSWSLDEQERRRASRMLTLLIAEPDAAICELLSEMLYGEGYRVVISDPLPTADRICRARPDGVILTLPPIDAQRTMQLLSDLRRRDETWSVPILLTATNNRLLDELRPQFDQLRCATLLKPFELEVLMSWAATLQPLP